VWHYHTRMWANAQRDGRPVEYRWRSVQRCKVWLMTTTRVPCSNAGKMQNPLKFVGVPQTPEPISAVSVPKFTILCGHLEEILLLNKFFQIVDMCLSCEDIAGQSCAMVPRWRFFASCISSEPCSTFQTCILNSHYGQTMCGSMVDIQSATAEIRRGKNIEEDRRRNHRAKI